MLVRAVLGFAAGLYWLLNGYGVISLLIVFLLARCLDLGFYGFLLLRTLPLERPAISLGSSWAFAREIKAFAASSFLGGLFARPEIILLSFFASPAQVGYYAAAIKLVDLWPIISDTYTANVLPALSRAFQTSEAKTQFIYDRSIKYLLAISLPLSVGIAVVAEPVTLLFFGAGFEASVPILQILAWSIPLGFVHSTLWRTLAAGGRQDLVLRAQAITVVVRLGGGVALISLGAAIGAAIVTVVSLFVHNQLLSHHMKQTGTRPQLGRLGWRFATAALAMGALTFALSQQLDLWVLIPAAAIIYLAFVILLRAFASEDVEMLRRVLQSGSEARQ
jgi:O-antigen/teichoic acid export membrane protein